MQQFTWKGRLGPLELDLSENTFAPSTISTLLAETMEVTAEDTVIDVGSGSGILAILAAKLGAKHVYATDVAADAALVGRANAERHGVADRVEFFSGNLFEPLPPDLRADLIIGDVSGVPDSLAAESGWFPSRTGGGASGSELPMRMLRSALAHLRAGGRLLLPTGSIQDEPAVLAAARSLFTNVRQLAERIIPLPSALAEGEAVRKLLAAGVINLVQKGSRWVWTARTWECAAPS